jgi:hypothetical protein
MNMNFIQDSVDKLEQIFYVERVMLEGIILLPMNIPAILFGITTKPAEGLPSELFYVAIGAPISIEMLETSAYCD